MTGENFSNNSEQAPSQSSGYEDFPPFDPDKAREEIAKARERMAEKEKKQEPEYDHSLYASESEWRAANSAAAQARREQNDSLSGTTSAEMYEEMRRQFMGEAQPKEPVEQVEAAEPEPEPVEENPIEKIPAEAPKNDIEFMTENEIRDAIGLLDASRMDVNQIFEMVRGSRSGEQAAAVLKNMSQRMLEQSNAMLSKMETSKDLGELEGAEASYKDEMGKGFGYSMQALRDLRNSALVGLMPSRMAQPFVFELQKVENNLMMINSIVARRHDAALRDRNPAASSEKLAEDNKEAEDLQ